MLKMLLETGDIDVDEWRAFGWTGSNDWQSRGERVTDLLRSYGVVVETGGWPERRQWIETGDLVTPWGLLRYKPKE
jgi:hypothetical protein